MAEPSGNPPGPPHALRMAAKTPLASDKIDVPAACTTLSATTPFHSVHTPGAVVMQIRIVSGYILVNCTLKLSVGFRFSFMCLFRSSILGVFCFSLAYLWSPYGIGQTIIFLPCGYYLSFFPRLISAAGDWMSTILPHMVWP